MHVQMSYRHSEIVDVAQAHFSALRLCMGAFIALIGRQSSPEDRYIHLDTCQKCEIERNWCTDVHIYGVTLECYYKVTID